MDKKIPFLDILIDNSQPQSPVTRVYRKKTFTRLLANNYLVLPYSLTNYMYELFHILHIKLGLIRTRVDRMHVYKINNMWVGFNKDIKKLLLILRKNLFPSQMAERVISILLKLRPF